jgi:hypothetical protein
VIELANGQQLLVLLGTDRDWTLNVGKGSVLALVSGAAQLTPGAQGLYVAEQPGSTTIAARGDAACRRHKPPCATPSLSFSARIVVR